MTDEARSQSVKTALPAEGNEDIDVPSLSIIVEKAVQARTIDEHILRVNDPKTPSFVGTSVTREYCVRISGVGREWRGCIRIALKVWGLSLNE